jgi:acyl carrier protein phosphodiesterase
MNYLAHAVLSFGHSDILIGNMISDFVKGRKKIDFPEAIQKGIQLHRLIDQFTDDHEVNRLARALFRPAYRLYAGAFVDVLYDHFLANDRSVFNKQRDLSVFTQQVYQQLNGSSTHLPSKFQNMLPYMQSQDWLYNYQFHSGLERSFEGLRRKALYIHETATAMKIFTDHNDELQQLYNAFFPQLRKFSEEQLRNLLAN